MTCRGFLLVSVVALLAVAALNAVVDPGDLCHSRLERQIVAWQAEGRNVLIRHNVNERLYQKLRVERLPLHPRVLIVGSSRAWPLGSGTVGAPSLNVSLGSVILRDEVALISMALARFPQIDTVIWQFDPWLCDVCPPFPTALKKEYETAAPLYLGRAVRKEEEWDDSPWIQGVKTFPELIKLDYLRASLKILAESRETAEAPFVLPAPGDEATWKMDVFLVDGQRKYSHDQLFPEIETVRKSARDDIPLRAKQVWSDAAEGDIQNMIASLQRRKIRIGIFLVPFHPLVYATEKDRAALQRAERFVRELASKRGVPVLGSYDPAACGLGEGDFLDGHHLVAEATQGLFASRPGWLLPPADPRPSAP